MSKAILMSIHPEWIAKIASGEKTVEVRKSAPKGLDKPFTVYMYESSGTQRVGNDNLSCAIGGNGRMAVVGQFTCNDICWVDKDSIGYCFRWPGRLIYAGEPGSRYRDCLTPQQRWDYLGIKRGYGWLIKDVRMFKDPVPLGSFYRYAQKGEDLMPCQNGTPCEYLIYDYGEDCEACAIDFDGENCPFLRVQSPPQSWMYVEER